MDKLAALLPVAPLVSAILITLLAGRFGAQRHKVARLSVGFAILTCALAVFTLLMHVSQPHPRIVSLGWGNLTLDALGSVMAVLVSGISLVVHVYSVRYMADDRGYARFYTLLDLMAMSILLMVTAGDLVTLLVAWHLVGVVLYFLLGHDLRRAEAQRYAFWTFFTYRMGDLPMILAAVLL